MRIRVPSYYNEFQCISSACEDTCCAGWDVVIDDHTYQRYQNMEGVFSEKIRKKMVIDQDGDHVFILEGSRCPFLNRDNLCDIVTEKGDQYLCYTCKQFPRYMEEFIDLREMGISLSCPEAARIILRYPKQTEFMIIEENQECDMAHDEDEDILEEFFHCRDDIIDILEMEDKSFGVRSALVLRFVQELQDKIDFDELDELNSVREKYRKSSYLEELIEELYRHKGDETVKYNDVSEYFKTYRDLEHINENDPLGLNKALKIYWNSGTDKMFYINKHKAFNHFYSEKMTNFKKIFVYFIYRYFMKSFYDYDMSSKIKLAMMSTIMIKELAVVRWMENGVFGEVDMIEVSQKYSKDVEHLKENIEKLERTFETDEVYTVDRMINTLMNEF